MWKGENKSLKITKEGNDPEWTGAGKRAPQECKKKPEQWGESKLGLSRNPNKGKGRGGEKKGGSLGLLRGDCAEGINLGKSFKRTESRTRGEAGQKSWKGDRLANRKCQGRPPQEKEFKKGRE